MSGAHVAHQPLRDLADEPLLRLRDNPIGIAMARRRMRRPQASATFIVLAILGACAMLYGMAGETARAWAGARNFLLAAIALLLYLAATSQVSAAVGEDRKSGLLDFHRATPTTAWTDATGYALGSAAREYVGVVVLLPFLLVATLAAGDAPLALPLALLMLLVTGWLCHALAMLTSLAVSRKRSARSSLAFVVLLLCLGVPSATAPGLTPALLTPLPALIELGILGWPDLPGGIEFYGAPVYRTLYSLVLQGTLLVFLFWASARKLRREGTHAFSRRGAFAFFSATSVLLVGPMWGSLTDASLAGVTIIGFLVALLLLASILAVSLVPSHLEYVRTLRRARRAGRQVGWLEDGASAWTLIPAYFGLTTLWLAILATAAYRAGRLDAVFDGNVALALLGCLSFVAFAVGVAEFLSLGLRQASRSGGFLIGFLCLVLPWVLGGILQGMGAEDVALYVMGVSPLFATGGSLVLLAMHWEVQQTIVGVGPVLFSLAFTFVLTGWFLWRAHGFRRAIDSGDGLI